MGKESKTKDLLRLKVEKGFISLLILLVVISLSWIGLGLFYQVSSQERIVRYEAQKIKALFLADSGLEWARHTLDKDPAWQGGNKLFHTGEVKVEVIKKDQEYRVISRAQADRSVQRRYGDFARADNGMLVLISYGEMFN